MINDNNKPNFSQYLNFSNRLSTRLGLKVSSEGLASKSGLKLLSPVYHNVYFYIKTNLSVEGWGWEQGIAHNAE